MANPYHGAAKGTAKAKFKSINRGNGGGSSGHSDMAQDKALFKGLMREHDSKAVGRKSGGRLDRRGHHRKTKITIEKSAPAGVPDPAAMGAAPPVAPPPTAMPPPGMGSGPMPQMGPAGLQKRGGRVKRAKGGRVGRADGGRAEDPTPPDQRNSQQDQQAAPSSDLWQRQMNAPYKKRGGGVGKYPIDAGQGTGEARLEQFRSAKKKG